MTAHLATNLSNLSFAVTPNDRVTWWGKCSADFDQTGDGYPVRGDVSFLNSFPAEISIQPRNDGDLNRTLMATGIDEQVRTWRAQGHNQPDVLLLRYDKKRGPIGQPLGVLLALDRTKLIHFEGIARQHFGSSKINVIMTCSFHGFRESSLDNPELPSKDEFLEGRRPYFSTTDLSFSFHPVIPIRSLPPDS